MCDFTLISAATKGQFGADLKADTSLREQADIRMMTGDLSEGQILARLASGARELRGAAVISHRLPRPGDHRRARARILLLSAVIRGQCVLVYHARLHDEIKPVLGINQNSEVDERVTVYD